MTSRRFPLGLYTARLTLAEAAGIAVVASAYALLDRGWLTAQGPVILTAGGVEGLCLGLAQAPILARLGAPRRRWVVLTVIGAVAGYGLSLVGGAGTGPSDAVDPPFWLLALGGGGLGLVMGVLMGLVQLPGLPPVIPPRRWVLANALGWIPAMSIIMAGAASVSPTWPLGAVALTGAVCGALAGAAVGLITGLSLARAT